MIIKLYRDVGRPSRRFVRSVDIGNVFLISRLREHVPSSYKSKLRGIPAWIRARKIKLVSPSYHLSKNWITNHGWQYWLGANTEKVTCEHLFTGQIPQLVIYVPFPLSSKYKRTRWEGKSTLFSSSSKLETSQRRINLFKITSVVPSCVLFVRARYCNVSLYSLADICFVEMNRLYRVERKVCPWLS